MSIYKGEIELHFDGGSGIFNARLRITEPIKAFKQEGRNMRYQRRKKRKYIY